MGKSLSNEGSVLLSTCKGRTTLVPAAQVAEERLLYLLSGWAKRKKKRGKAGLTGQLKGPVAEGFSIRLCAAAAESGGSSLYRDPPP